MSHFKLPAPDPDPAPTPKSAAKFQTLELKSAKHYTLSTQRGADDQLTEVVVADDAVVKVVLDGGFELWMRGDDLRRELASPPTRGDDDAWRLKPGMATDDAERGWGDWALKALAIFDIEPQKLAAKQIATLAERDKHNQLLHVDAPDAGSWRSAQRIDAADPVLLFIHGTFSSTQGSFGDLFTNPATWNTLCQNYPGRIYGFEHRTVSESPIENLLALVDYLPKGVCLHLVSHSRGGLVGDLLALAATADKPFTAAALKAFIPSQRAALQRLQRKLASRELRIERFVRVASPSRGTTLASGRTDRWLSVISWLIKKIPVVGGALGEALLEFLLAVVKERTDPRSLPGLEAMMPGSALVRLLNSMPDTLPGTLAAIAGDIEGEGLAARLKLKLPDLFFAGPHDLVVNTGSMYGGPTREHGYYRFDQGGNVNHFNYFLPQNTAADVIRGLTGALPPAGFRPITKDLQVAPARGATTPTGRRPVLFVLPGIMGSELAVDQESVWLHAGRLALGGLSRLDLDSTAGQDAHIEATGLLDMAYGELLNYFGQSHDVVPFAYDWRQSIEHSGDQLAAAIETRLPALEANGQALCILAHSMGGLVARAMIARHGELWERMRRHPGGRLVMLGTPNGGSWEIVSLLLGKAATLKKLAMLDLRHSGFELLDIISDFPGVLELLPDDPRDPFTSAFWTQLQQQDEHGAHRWRPPGSYSGDTRSRARLAKAGKVRQRLRAQAIDPGRMVYVAGQAEATACDVRAATIDPLFFGDGTPGLEVLASARGDSSVLWDTGTLPGVPTWFMPGVAHGDLANTPESFPALLDLVRDGRTDALSERAPTTRGGAAVFPLPERDPSFLPDERSLLASALGMGPPRAAAQAIEPVQVAIIHGDLGASHATVAVGHYSGDTIVAAEDYLDRVLGGRLRRCQQLGLYPGEIGSHAVFRNPRPEAKPKGALTVGLGPVGVLTPSSLAATFSRALLAYCRDDVEQAAAPPPGRDHGVRQLALSSLLIGTGAGGISVNDSLTALLRGLVRANRLLDATSGPTPVRIGRLDLIELWEERAIQAAHALAAIDRDPELHGMLDCTPTLQERDGGKRGYYNADDPGWWHRLKIVAPAGAGMRFTSLTQRARAEQDPLPSDEDKLDLFVRDTIDSTQSDAETSRTLFEMLLPNRLKDGQALRSKLVLVLDERSARFPWEMLEDRWSQSGKPPAVEHGMVRQLSTEHFREQPTLSRDRRALVIGDPKSDFVPLPGAQKEAEAVRQLLEDTARPAYRVESTVGGGAGAILSALHRHAYEILHLAGHGVHEQVLQVDGQDDGPGTPQSGMIIGKGMVLNAADIRQMRRVPKLVFINCCHLGRTDGGERAGKPADHSRAHRLAANLAVQFIEMGVGAVVAAGWAVNDDAAVTFARTLYRELLGDRCFGEAVRIARERTWGEHQGINTWGAYQCYGDPDFTLSGDSGRADSADAAGAYVSPSEVLADLHNLRADARSTPPDRLSGLKRQLSDIEQRIDTVKELTDHDWRARGEVAEQLGLAHGELGGFEAAVDYLDQAIHADNGRFTGMAMAMRARFHGRWALALHQGGRGDAAAEQFAVALAGLAAMTPDDPDTLSDQLYRSYTSIYSRRVQTLAPSERLGDLKRLVKSYDDAETAHQRIPGEDPLGPYSRLLWLTGKLMMTAYSSAKLEQLCPDFETRCIKLEQRINQTLSNKTDFYATVNLTEIHLLLALKNNTLNDERVNALIEALQSAINRGGNQRQMSSLLNNLNLLYNLAASATHKKSRFLRQAEQIDAIRKALL